MATQTGSRAVNAVVLIAVIAIAGAAALLLSSLALADTLELADGTLLEEIAAPDAEGRALLTQAAERMKLTARGYHRVLRVARTLADLEGAESVRRVHIAEALSYRRIAPGR